MPAGIYPPLTSAPCKSSTGPNRLSRPPARAAPLSTAHCLRSRVQVLAFRYKPQACSWVHVVAGMVTAGFGTMGKLVADIIIETLQSAGVKHCYGIVGDTLNLLARSLEKSEIEWVSVRHEEAGAFAAQAEAQVADRLTAVAGSSGPGSLHFINGIFEANRNRAPVILIASQIIRDELGFDFIQEVDFKQVYRDCSVFCDMIHTPEQARRKTVIACQTALAKRGVAVLIVPADISASVVDDSIPYAVHVARPVTRPNDADLSEIADILNNNENVVLYGGSGCQGAHQEILAVANKLKAPIAHTSRAKDFLEFDNPYNIGMTGILGNEAGYHALLDCDAW